jgi:hypothetical protein
MKNKQLQEENDVLLAALSNRDKSLSAANFGPMLREASHYAEQFASAMSGYESEVVNVIDGFGLGEMGTLTLEQIDDLRRQNELEIKAREPGRKVCLLCNGHFPHPKSMNHHIDSHFRVLHCFKRKFKNEFYKLISPNN